MATTPLKARSPGAVAAKLRPGSGAHGGTPRERRRRERRDERERLTTERLTRQVD